MSRLRVSTRVAKGVYVSTSISPGTFALFYLPFTLASVAIQILWGLIQLAWAVTVFFVRLHLLLFKFLLPLGVSLLVLSAKVGVGLLQISVTLAVAIFKLGFWISSIPVVAARASLRQRHRIARTAV